MNSSRLLLSAAALSFLGHPAHALVSDNFNDNLLGPEWTLLRDDASRLNLTEQTQRLEITSNVPTDPNLDAIYLSNGPSGFRISTSQNFQISMDYNFLTATSNGIAGSRIALVFGVGRDLPNGTDSAAVGYGYINDSTFGVVTALGAAYRTDDVESRNALGFGPSSGQFQISYNAAGDDLTLGVVGVTPYTLNDTVRAIWGANDLYVSFGGRGSGFNIASGNAVLDNFSVDSGSVLAVPEPSSVALLGVAGLALGLGCRRRRHSGQ